ncbi:MAG TPA: hypothetical protein VD995_10515 [Azospirillum sp.]|nr:hypothetical protein [Azospirillum sp.]
MNVATIAQRLFAGDLYYALGRFESVRRGYSLLCALVQNAEEPAVAPAALPTLFPRVSIDNALAAIRRDSVSFGFDLPPDVLAGIQHFADTAECRERGREQTFRRADVVRGRLADGTPLVHGLIDNPMRCAAVRRVCEDPVLVEAAGRFLGYRVRRVLPRVFWSFASGVSDDERRRRGQTIDWHFDVHDYNFISACFYLSDVDRGAGPHALLRGSHTGKPARMLLGSANARDEEVFEHFGRDRVMVIEGPAGTGFLEDTSCYHKAMPPTERDRLMFQIWFS